MLLLLRKDSFIKLFTVLANFEINWKVIKIICLNSFFYLAMQVPTLYSVTFKIWFKKCIFLFYSNSAVFIIIIKIVKQKCSWGFQKQTVGKQKLRCYRKRCGKVKEWCTCLSPILCVGRYPRREGRGRWGGGGDDVRPASSVVVLLRATRLHVVDRPRLSVVARRGVGRGRRDSSLL